MEFDDDEKIVTLHESAHAVAAWLMGATIHDVTISGPISEKESPNKRTPFFCKFQLPSTLSSSRITSEDINRRLVIDFAPCVVSEEIFGKPGSINDIVDLIKFLTWANRDVLIKRLINDAQQAVDVNHASSYPNARGRQLPDFCACLAHGLSVRVVFALIEDYDVVVD